MTHFQGRGGAYHRYFDNFITLARTLGIFDNPALPLPRAQRRALERLRRKQTRYSHSVKV
ncbi:MAG: hypothetical protein ACI4AM_03005 [Muribaculaceae bacterium]